MRDWTLGAFGAVLVLSMLSIPILERFPILVRPSAFVMLGAILTCGLLYVVIQVLLWLRLLPP
jgi:hypothetical protein